MTTAQRFTMVDGLRGIAASWVVLFHASEGGHLRALEGALPSPVVTALFHAGHFGVSIFFVLSGFVIAHSLHQRAVDIAFFGRFALRRSIRLDPPYFMSIVLVVALGFVSARVKGEPFDLPSLGTLGAHATYTMGIQQIAPLDASYWTLPYEFQFYLVLCSLLGVARVVEKRWRGMGIPLVFTPLCVLALAWPTGIATENVQPGLWLDLWYAFLLGVLSYWSWRAWTNADAVHSGRARAAQIAFLAFAAVVLVGALARGDTFAIVAALTALALRAAAAREKIGVWLNWRWLQFLGTISYSLYLTHNPIGGAAFFLARRFVGSSAVAEAVSLVVVMAVSIACAAAFYFVFERPFISLAQKVKLAPRGA